MSDYCINKHFFTFFVTISVPDLFAAPCNICGSVSQSLQMFKVRPGAVLKCLRIPDGFNVGELFIFCKNKHKQKEANLME